MKQIQKNSIKIINYKYQLLFVTSVFNRFNHLKDTLPKNLQTVREFENVGLLVVDFGGADSSKIERFIDEYFTFDIMAGKLNYYRIKIPWTKFHMATAKNIAHRLLDADFLFSLDADNIICKEDISTILFSFNENPNYILHQTTGLAPMYHIMWKKYNLFLDADLRYHNIDLRRNGSYGRIGISKKNFEKVNGYNEFFNGMRIDDIDFIMRNIINGAYYKHLQITRPTETIFIENCTGNTQYSHKNDTENWSKMDIALMNHVITPKYIPRDTVKNYYKYIPKCVNKSTSMSVTLISNVFKAESFKKRFFNDVLDILKSSFEVCIWILDIRSSNSSEFSKRLRQFCNTNLRLFYIPVFKDPGLYETWNICIKNINSPYVGNFNVDDIRGPGWIPTCLKALNKNRCDVASPRIIPFEDNCIITYDQITNYAKKHTLPIWFKNRVIFNANKPEPQPLINGKYFHEDMFQVLPNEMIESYNITNASPIWKRKIHNKIGFFNEKRDGCFADLALWLEAMTNGFKFKQIDYDVFFYLTNEQAHKRQRHDIKRLFALVLKYGSLNYQLYTKRRLFDLSHISGNNDIDHTLYWNWIQDNVNSYFIHTENALLLDLYIERTFFCNSVKNKEYKFQYKKDWIGFVRDIPFSSKIYTHQKQYLNILFNEPRFIKSLDYCKGLIVLNNYLKMQVEERLVALDKNIPVYLIFHPSISLEYSNNINKNELFINNKIYHIGLHPHSLVIFARLNIEKDRKIVLLPKDIDNDKFIIETINKELANQGLDEIQQYVEKIYFATKDEYIDILKNNIIFNNYMQSSDNTLIFEDLLYSTLFIINRHSTFEEYLGRNYPLFYKKEDKAVKLINKLNNKSFRNKVNNYLNNRNKKFSIDRFICELEQIAVKIYKTEYE